MIFLKMGKYSDFQISPFQVEDAWRTLQFNRKTEKYCKEFIWFGGMLSQNYVQPSVWIFNHVSRVITWSLSNFRAPDLVK